jgi:hypothetical protein
MPSVRIVQRFAASFSKSPINMTASDRGAENDAKVGSVIAAALAVLALGASIVYAQDPPRVVPDPPVTTGAARELSPHDQNRNATVTTIAATNMTSPMTTR